MIYIRSIIAGVLAVILVASTLLIAMVAALLFTRTSFLIGWDPRGLKSLTFWIVVALVFALGYAWEYWRDGIQTDPLP